MDTQSNTPADESAGSTESTAATASATATAVEAPASHGHDDVHAAPAPGGALYGVLAEFRSPGALKAAARKVHEAGYTQFDCYSPFPVHGIDDAMGIKRTRLPLAVFAGGSAGLLGGLFLQWWMNALNWPIIISGKPTWSLPANIPIAFETTILLSVFTTFFGMWIANKLPQVWHPFFRLDRFAKVTDDGLMLGIEAADPKFSTATRQLLLDAGALEVEDCYLDPDPASRQLPKAIGAFIICTTALALVPLALIAKARTSKSSEPHFHIFADMDFQEKIKSDAPTDFFADGRGNRGAMPGTVARGSLNADDLFYRGIETPPPAPVAAAAPVVPTEVPVPAAAAVPATAATPATAPATTSAPVPPPAPVPTPVPVAAADPTWTTRFPLQLNINDDLMARGQERYNIFCAPCHGYDGRGAGTIRKRSEEVGNALPVANIVEPSAKRPLLPNGQLFNVISNGVGTMAGYAAQIPHADRWAIVLYVRALQRGQNASAADAGTK